MVIYLINMNYAEMRKSFGDEVTLIGLDGEDAVALVREDIFETFLEGTAAVWGVYMYENGKLVEVNEKEEA